MDTELSKGAEPVEAQGGYMYSVYILKNSKNHLYVGCTEDTDIRLKRHNSGDGAEFTKRNKDFKLVYEEKCPTLLKARRRESQLKGSSRAKKEALIKGDLELLKSLSKKKRISYLEVQEAADV